MKNPNPFNTQITLLPPVAFVACGADEPALFRAKTPHMGFFFRKDRIGVETVSPKGKNTVLELLFCGVREDMTIKGEGKQFGTLNYVIGGNAQQWHPNMTAYEKLLYEGIWEGVDLELFGDANGLKFNWTLKKANAAPSIRLHWSGCEELALSDDGSLLIGYAGGILADTAPAAWQYAGGSRQKVACAYRLLDEGEFGFALSGEYDPDLPLVIDPLIAFLGF